MIKTEQLQEGIQLLAGHGLNLFATFSLKRFPTNLLEKIPTRPEDNTLILIGHAGTHLWKQIQEEQALSGADPIDHYSIEKAKEFSRLALNDAPITIHYPGDAPIGLQQLGILAGWHHTSPMGIGINQQWGLWYAYRVVLSTPQELPEIRQEYSNISPCSNCDTPPCIKGCPAEATSQENGLDLERCVQYRLTDNSPCAYRCIARQSCPVAEEARYSEEQINYHYRQSFETLQQFYGKKS